MYFNEMVPRDNYLAFIPEFLLDDEVPASVFSSLAPFLAKQGMSIRDYVGFVSGAEELQKILREENDDESTATWFKTEKVEDVRLLFRAGDRGAGRTLGSKMRLYSLGTPYGGGEARTQHLDSGFITYNSRHTGSLIYQKALASTMLYCSLYCIGGPATVRKINVPSGKNDTAPSYKWLSAVRPGYTEDIDRLAYTHVLSAAMNAAGLEPGFFENRFLDAFMKVLLTSSTMDELRDGLLDLPEDFTDEDIDEIIAASNTREANLSDTTPDNWKNSEGLNIVQTFVTMGNILD